MKRKFFSMITALALCLSLCPFSALAAEGDGTEANPWKCGDNVTAWLSDDNTTLTISGSGAMADYTTTRGSRPWDAQRGSIQKVDIQNSVTSIGACAFYQCQKLTSVELPSSLTTIPARAFVQCMQLTAIEIPNGVTRIETNAFYYSGLVSVTIPPSVTHIYNSAFEYCTSLTRVDIPTSVKTIETDAFSNAPNAEIYYAGTLAQWSSISGSGGCGATTVYGAPHKVTVDGSDNPTGAGDWNEGKTVTVSAGTNFGYAFTGWTVTGLDATGLDLTSPSLTFTMPANDVTLAANWAEAVANVDDVSFTDLQEAFNYAAGHGGTVFLRKSVTVDQPITMSEGSVTLESEGKTLTGTGPSTLEVTGGYLYVQGVTVKNTFQGEESVPGVIVGGTAISISSGASLTVYDGATVSATGPSGTAISSSGTLAVNGGTVSATGSDSIGIYFSGGTGRIEGGTISGGRGLWFNTSGSFSEKDVTLTGGTFTGTTGNAIAVTSNATLGDLLDDGLALINNETGEAVNPEDQYTGSGAFTVGCAHPGVENVTSSGPDANGVVTVTATCQKCNQTVTLGTLTMVGSGQEITYMDPPPTFEVKASEGLDVTGYKWSGTGLYDKTSPAITPVVSKTGELAYTCRVTFNVPGGTASANLEFTLTVNRLDISTVEWDVRMISPEKAAYNGQPQKITSIAAAIKGKEDDIFGEDQLDVQLVDATGNAAAEQTNAGTYTVKLTGKDVFKGAIMLDSPVFVIEKAVPAIAWAAGTEESHEYAGGPVAIERGPTVTLAEGETYREETHGKITYFYATSADGPYTEGLPKDVGTYYIKAAVPEQKNYTRAETEETLTLVITKAATTVTPPAAVNPAYNGKPQALVTAAEASVGVVQYALSADGPWSTSIPTATVPGEYTVWYKVDETANYTGVEARSVTAKIEKATVMAASQSLPVKNNLAKTYTLDLSPYLPTLPQGQEYGELTYTLTEVGIGDPDYIAENTVNLVDTVLTVPVNKVDKTVEGSVAAITVTIQSDNFQDIRLTVSVTTTNKTPLIITGVTAQGWTYDGTVHPGYTGTPRAEGYTGEFLVTYFTEGKNRKDAGTFRVEFTPKDLGYEGSRELPYTVEPARVTVKADDKTAYVGDAKPELTYQVSGLAEGERLKAEPAPACDPDMSKAGTYPITISGGAVPDGGNYKAEIVYQSGTLTVEEKSAPPKPVDPGQIETRMEVEKGISQVPEGLKNIPELDSPQKLEAAMRTSITQTGIPAQNTAVYDVKLMVSNDGGQTWTPATEANFPAAGLTITLPYPEGTDSTYQFTVVHMFTTAAFGQIPGNTESPAVTNTEAGLRFTVAGLSPISVGWKEKEPDRPVTPGRPSGGGSDVSTYRVTVERTVHGKVASNRTYAPEDSAVTLTVTPDSGYVLDALTVTDSRGNAVKLTDKGDGRYTFSMPGRAVTVKAGFKAVRTEWNNPYSDVAAGAWYYDAARYVTENGLMKGVGGGHFAPNDTLTRAQLVQILYNRAGRPAVQTGSRFSDVGLGAWYDDAVAWAASEKIVSGVGGGRFAPGDPVTREQMAVMLWRYAGRPAATEKELSFTDADQAGGYALDALHWAVERGIISGKSGGVLDPKGLATRAQTAQMLMNLLKDD